MTEEQHHESHILPQKLNIMDWKAPSSDEMHDWALENVSPWCQEDEASSTEASHPSTTLMKKGPNSTTTTPVPPSQPFGPNGFSLDYWNQIRQVFREEVEVIQGKKLLAENPVFSSISSTSGPVVSSIDPSPANVLPFSGSTNPTAAASAPSTQKPGVRLFNNGRTFSKRAAGVGSSSSSSNSESMADWGLLFDHDGFATQRMGQILRGLAKHLINEYAMMDNFITPDRLGTFYSKYRLETELFPFADIFTSKEKDANERVDDFYGDLECPYHLVQRNSRCRPRIPALTPVGFAQYFTICILAFPDQEFRRFKKIVADIPITVDSVNADARPEKLPRTLTRNLFPAKYDVKQRKLLDGALQDLMEELRITFPGPRSPVLPPATLERRGSAAGFQASHLRYTPPVGQTMGGDILSKEYDPKNGRKLFTPGTLQTIGDESFRGDSHCGKEYDRNQQVDANKQPPVNSNQGTSNTQPRFNDFVTPVNADQHPPINRFEYQSHPSANGTRSCAQSSTQHTLSHPSMPSATIPPPPVASAHASSSRRPRSPPPLKSHSFSVPDIHSTGRTSTSSSTTMFTPSTISSASVSPPLEHSKLLNPQHSLNSGRCMANMPGEGNGLDEIQNTAPWTGGGREFDTKMGTEKVILPGIGRHGVNGRLKRPQRPRRATAEDVRGPTWEEYLKCRKIGGRSGH